MVPTAVEPFIPFLAFISVALLSLGIYRLRNERRELIRERLENVVSGTPGPFISSEAVSSILRGPSEVPSIDDLIKAGALADRIALDLARANIRLRVTEYILIRLGVALFLGLFLFIITRNPFIALTVAIIGYYLPRVYVRRVYHQRLKKLDDELVDVLSLISNSLKAGYGFSQAMEDVSKEMPPPISQEFQTVLREMALGADTDLALHNMVARVGSYDLDLIVTAVLISRRAGGNLAEVLENISHTIRERQRILGEVRAMTAEVRLSAWILGALPFVITLILAIIAPNYISTLFTNILGRLMIGGTLVLMTVGILALRRLGTIEV